MIPLQAQDDNDTDGGEESSMMLSSLNQDLATLCAQCLLQDEVGS